MRHLNKKSDNELEIKFFIVYDLEIWRMFLWLYVHLISDKKLYHNENGYSVKIKPLSGSCHMYNLIYMKVLLWRVKYLVKDPEEEKYNEKV